MTSAFVLDQFGRLNRKFSFGSLLILSLGLPSLAQAHAVVFPAESAPGAYEKYVLRVPNEKAIPTTRVEIRFPPNLRVISFGDVPGWRVETLADSAGNITRAVWTGTLPAARFVEFPFIAVNPPTSSRLEWPTLQTYADGEVVEWNGPEGSPNPASTTEIAPNREGTGGSSTPLYLAGSALLISLVGLGLALRK